MASHIGKRSTVKPPERGIFPLDHDGECKALMKLYVACLRTSDSDHYRCRTESGNYLKVSPFPTHNPTRAHVHAIRSRAVPHGQGPDGDGGPQ